MIDFARLEHLLDERATLGGALDGHQERKQCRSVSRAGVLLKGLSERLMLHAPLGREPGNEGRQECEWVLRVALVLREVKGHAADEPPLGVSLAEVGLDSTLVVLDLGADERVEIRPPGCENIGGEVLTTVHGRRMEYLKRQVGLGGLRYGRDCTSFPIRGRLTEPGQVQTGEVARSRTSAAGSTVDQSLRGAIGRVLCPRRRQHALVSRPRRPERRHPSRRPRGRGDGPGAIGRVQMPWVIRLS